MQDEYPLTSQLMGLWSFNQLVQEHLRGNPPQGADISSIAENFEFFLQQHGAGLIQSLKISLPAQLINEAARIDRAFQESFLAKGYQPWSLQADQVDGLAELQLQAAPAFRIIAENWALMDYRSRLMAKPQAEPQSLAQTQSWLIFRRQEQVGQWLLHPLQAQLYEALCHRPLGVALLELQQQCSASDANFLADATQQWMAQSVNLGLWMTGEA